MSVVNPVVFDAAVVGVLLSGDINAPSGGGARATTAEGVNPSSFQNDFSSLRIFL